MDSNSSKSQVDYLVLNPIRGAHPILWNYDLLPGDLLREEAPGSFSKLHPGMVIEGFRLDSRSLEELGAVQPLS